MTMRERHSGHEQVAVKVNAFVDRGIAPLVQALNSIDGVITLDSCQETSVADTGQAVMYFTYGTDWRDLAALVARIAGQLRTLDLDYAFSARLEWLGSNDQPRAQLVIQPEHVVAIAACLSGGPDR